MPTNLLKTYNQLLEFLALEEGKRKDSLLRVFNRDFNVENPILFKSKCVYPTPKEGQDKLAILFTHLTTVIQDKKERNRIFDIKRSERLHWVRYHLNETKQDEMLVFSVKEPEGNRTYIYDKKENYVVILEPLRRVSGYYLLTAYYIEGKDVKRDKILKKYKRKLDEIL
ncbi:hypothetical protein [Lacihabitans sp. CS3-21]|uniref:hypothetical protein n=1 Tax=Lacihabitans sp. CS3-21 TaxID=2487332 RepID=UPI0020CF15DF|nr:hypothetical protein [Lacihabitans sp. CS3-21]MCP9745985.1 hypothetical protein [Lacihabitans sp. CS3-21]